jgi:hypothetical protein
MTTYLEFDDGLLLETENPQFHNHRNGKQISKAQYKRKKKEFAINELKGALKPGDIVYTVIRHVSASGMSRDIDLYIIKDNRPQYLTNYISYALEYPLSKNRGIKVGGCGMDMGFHVVYTLSSILFDRDGYALKQEWL